MKHYVRLAAMTVLMFIAMYALMYAMVDRLENVLPNINQFYMAGLMTAPMVIIKLLIMRGMYERRGVNLAIIVVSLAAFALFWIGIRQQTAVADEQFLRSMIPHHAGAVLMCEEAPIEDAEIAVPGDHPEPESGDRADERDLESCEVGGGELQLTFLRRNVVEHLKFDLNPALVVHLFVP